MTYNSWCAMKPNQTSGLGVTWYAWSNNMLAEVTIVRPSKWWGDSVMHSKRKWGRGILWTQRISFFFFFGDGGTKRPTFAWTKNDEWIKYTRRFLFLEERRSWSACDVCYSSCFHSRRNWANKIRRGPIARSELRFCVSPPQP